MIRPVQMLLRCTSLVAALALLSPSATAAVRPRGAVADNALEARAVKLRTSPKVTWNRAPQRALGRWARSNAAAAGWTALWDDATGVPLRLQGRGVPAPGSSRDAAAALAHARATLAADLALLAPGARVTDFALAANVERGGVRTVAFQQLAGGLPVLGGQVSFRFKRDRLIAIASEAVPDVVAAAPGRPVPRAIGRLLAETWMTTDLGAPVLGGAVDGPFVLPLIGDGGVLGARTVLRVRAEGAAPRGRWDVYVDAASGAPVARRQTLMFAEGSLAFDVSRRHPGGSRQDAPARDAGITVDGVAGATDADGNLSWSGGATAALVTQVSGPQVDVIDESGAAPATTSLSIAPGATATWSAASDEMIDAQLNAFIHAREVKDYVRARFAGGLPWLDEQLPVHVNIDDSCNAFSDGDSINFFRASTQCANTARLADVIYHEFGHALHAHAIIPGAGAFDSAFSEGLSDYLAASMTGDPGMGRGFFNNDNPLRHIDPADREQIWPEDVGEAHYTGLIFAGAMWDLRDMLVEKYGEEDGALLADRLFYGAVQRASSIPATYTEILVEDDDDGDLSNGTPNACEINATFAAHGLRRVDLAITPHAAVAPGADGYPIELQVTGLLSQCPGDGVAGASLEWSLRDSPDDVQRVDLSEDGGVWSGAIPGQADGAVVTYAVRIDFLDGTRQSFPDNAADPRYEFYVGELVELYCTGFEEDPFADGWSHGLRTSEGAIDDWAWGAPEAPSGSGDPAAAFVGDGVLGNALGGEANDGVYKPDTTSYAAGPTVSIEAEGGGRYSDVRLQYWRWLNVEDAFFDQATIRVDGEQVWQNLNSDRGDSSSTQHLDREWRFHDVPLSPAIRDASFGFEFELASDAGLEFGGWTIDELCVVAAAGKICGDGELVEPEQCDDGAANSDTEPNACRASCRVASCGDGVVDDGEECDDGNQTGGDGCAVACVDEGDGGAGCACRAGGGPGPAPAGGALALGLALLAGLRRRRRSGRDVS